MRCNFQKHRTILVLGHLVIEIFFLVVVQNSNGLEYPNSTYSETESLQRNPRTWLTNDMKLVFPKGTVLSITPQIQFPLLKQEESVGFKVSDLSVSWLFFLYLDKMGLTSDENPWPPQLQLPPFFPFGSFIAPNVQNSGKRWGAYKRPRSVLDLPPSDKLPGGERAHIFPKLEKVMETLGWQGRICLLRAVCEINQYFTIRERNAGVLGEFIWLFFSISKSPFAESHMPEYLKSEKVGREGNGKCAKEYANCRHSFFKSNAPFKN